MPWLLELSKAECIQTITPGVIKKTKGRSEYLTIKVSTSIKGGYKLLARKGSTVQEVFVVTKVTEENLSLMIRNSKPKKTKFEKENR